jgi:molybdenum cofactor biosynthesis protein MoaC/molybdopterin converting factor subunit 1
MARQRPLPGAFLSPRSGATPGGTVIEVRLFAVLRERAGKGSLTLELPSPARVSDALRALGTQESLVDLLARVPLRMAVNRDYADADTLLQSGDELALIPPVSGGAPESESRSGPHVRVGSQALSVEALIRAVADPGAGAIVVFQGVTRDVPRLEYEAYEEMAQEQIELILRECVSRHDLRGAGAEHRVGEVPLGEPSVIVAVSAAHREQAFAGAREAIDHIKAQAPIWKREHHADGSAQWVEGSHAADAVEEPGSLTHIDEAGRARMVDIQDKPLSERVARARARVRMAPATAAAVLAGNGPKGEVLGVARIAGVQAAKQTGLLIPLAHPLALTFADVSAGVDADAGLVELIAEARTVGRTGVEMEAMTAAAVAALTVYDMVKGLERGVVLEEVVLLEKRGGRNDYRLQEP